MESFLRVCVIQHALHEGEITITFKIGNQWLNEVQKAGIGITIKTDVKVGGLIFAEV